MLYAFWLLPFLRSLVRVSASVSSVKPLSSLLKLLLPSCGFEFLWGGTVSAVSFTAFPVARCLFAIGTQWALMLVCHQNFINKKWRTEKIRKVGSMEGLICWADLDLVTFCEQGKWRDVNHARGSSVGQPSLGGGLWGVGWGGDRAVHSC